MMASVPYRDDVHAQWESAHFTLHPATPTPLFAQLAREIRAKISTWNLPVGAMLPSVPMLAERHGLSRETVTKAYDLLRSTGTIEVRRGAGCFVAQALPTVTVTPTPGSEVAVRPIRPDDVDATGSMVALTLLALVVMEPGKPPVAYDPMRTVVRVDTGPPNDGEAGGPN
jgi:DNA-binding transcriptional regulator YhcF (GntR family)